MQRTGWVLGLLGLIGALAGGCGDSTGGMGAADLGPVVPVCNAGAKNCLTDRVARVCAPDGAAWVPVQCRAGELCTDGECTADPNPTCTAADDRCMNATTALRCSTVGKGFDVVSCPSDTTCTGVGLCKGSCVVGSSRCGTDGSLATCLDGKIYTATRCAAGQACVTVATGPVEHAACRPSECAPAKDGCDFVCGNRGNAQAVGQEGYLSFCQETTEGYKWVAVQCAAGKTCSPSGASCGSNGATQADCASDCTPGDTRCANLSSSGGGDSAIQTCGPDGKWAATVNTCNPNPASGGKVCFARPGDPSHVLCGDRACSVGSGACDATGKLHRCDNNGLVSTEGAACATGLCVQSGNVAGAWQPGLCVDQCATGGEQCLGGSSFRACAAKGLWGAVANCANNVDCLDTTTPAGRAAKVCGECLPGSTRCHDGMSPAGDGAGFIQTCDANATWGGTNACTVGRCMGAPWGNEAVCLAECIPARELCLGNDTGLTGLPYSGTDRHGVCTSDGKIPSSVACPADTMCRKNAGGVALGCVACVGAQNEFGMADTRCANALGDPGSSHVQTCRPDSSGWQGLASLLVCTSSTCQDATTDPIPTVRGRYCHSDNFTNGQPVTQTYLVQHYGASCSDVGSGITACAAPTGALLADCCDSYCYADPLPLPASCVD